MRPIRGSAAVYQRFPSGPAVIPVGSQLDVGLVSSVRVPLGVLFVVEPVVGRRAGGADGVARVGVAC
jgi:hypothetical protein